jgi:hypothetical protein
MGAYLGRRDRAFAMLPNEEQQQILLLADGSVGRALELINSAEREPLMQRRAVAASFVSAMLERRDAEKMTELMAGFGKSREDIMALLVDIETALRDLILLKRSDEVVLRFYTDPANATELGERVPMQTLLSLLDRAESTRRQLRRNANVRLALTALLF